MGRAWCYAPAGRCVITGGDAYVYGSNEYVVPPTMLRGKLLDMKPPSGMHLGMVADVPWDDGR